MKKIIIAFDGQHYSTSTMEFVLSLNQMERVALTAVFLSPVDYTAIWSFPILPGGSDILSATGDNKSENVVSNNMKRFEETCQLHQIPYRIHNDINGMVFSSLKKESRFADLLLVSNQLFYEQIGRQPNDYLQNILQIVECPVLLIPEKGLFPERIVFAYDGSESSIYAVKQFYYLFPSMCRLPTTLMYAKAGKDEIPDQVNAEELLLRHFSDLSIELLDDDNPAHLVEWMRQQPSALLITGAYGRSGISQLFRKSFAKEIVKEHFVPVFIAHK
ncbi:MAG TPA: universal stress protein [Ferruginibacter sp.]|nr:universal stress protein [Ferruginibacter sp.]